MHWCNQPVDFGLMGKGLLATLLLLAFGLQVFQKPIMLADYYADIGSYEANCENKLRPELQCHGKCQVVKKIAQAEKKDQQNPERKLENKQEVFAGHNLQFTVALPVVAIQKQQIPAANIIGYSQQHLADIFHPPQA